MVSLRCICYDVEDDDFGGSFYVDLIVTRVGIIGFLILIKLNLL